MSTQQWIFHSLSFPQGRSSYQSSCRIFCPYCTMSTRRNNLEILTIPISYILKRRFRRRSRSRFLNSLITFCARTDIFFDDLYNAKDSLTDSIVLDKKITINQRVKKNRSCFSQFKFLNWTLYRYKVLISKVITYRVKLLNADWLRQLAFFLKHKGTFGNQEGMIT